MLTNGKKRFRWCTIAKVKLSSAFKAVLILILLAHRTARPTPLATTHGRNFLRVRRIREQAHDAPPQVIFSPLVLCCCLPLSARQKGFPPWTHFLRAIPCNHAWHAVTDMSNVPRTPATPSVPPPEPCVCVLACRNLRSHHTSITHHRLTGSKQPRLALTLSFCQCQRTTPHGPIVLLSLLACFPKLSACLPHHAIPSSM